MGSSSSTFVDSTDEQLSGLKCLNCKELLTVVPIFWYLNRGNVCGRCPQVLHNDGYRNEALEAVIKIQKLPCRYKKNNCSETMDYTKVKKHEESCVYRQYSCPTIPINCTWIGKRSEMKKHFEEKHVNCLMDGDDFINFCRNKNYEQNILIQTLKKQFLVQLRYENTTSILRCGLIYFEEPSENKQYVFTINLKNGDSTFTCKIKNSRFLSTYLLATNEMYEIDFDKIALLVEHSKILNYKISITEE